MNIFLTDRDIDALVSEPKVIRAEDRKHLRVNRDKPDQIERSLDVVGVHGNWFRIILRQHREYPAASFSVILLWLPPKPIKPLVLTRYDGDNHLHRCPIERTSFEGFHIHRTTERYLTSIYPPDQYAELSTAFPSFDEAVKLFLRDCAVNLAEPFDPIAFFEVNA